MLEVHDSHPTILEFTYVNVPPPAARPGLNTNRIRLWYEGDTLKYDRRYVCDDGRMDGTPIEHTFEAKDSYAFAVARQIHWGCCGWDAGGHQLTSLRDLVAGFIDNHTGRNDKVETDPIVKHHRNVSLDGEALVRYLQARFKMTEAEARHIAETTPASESSPTTTLSETNEP